MFRRWITPRTLLAVASVALILAGLSQMFEIRTPNRPVGTWRDISSMAERDDLNVVFVVVDTLRADRLSAYGYERPTSPILDAMADSGILFRNVQAQSTWTKTSMASLWSATYPATNGVTRWPHGMPDGVRSPAEILREAGLRTVGIWRNGWVAPNFGFGQGFDLYYKPMVRKRGETIRQDNPSAFRLPGTDLDLTQAALEFLRSSGASERFFLYLHYMDVHQYVYDQSADFGTTYSDIYDNSIRWVDGNLGTVVAVLQEQELMDRTIVVVASDHGEAFREHGTEGHARNLYRETTHVPLLITLPIRLEEGIEVTTPVENIDIWPTVLDLMGLPPMPGAQGRSLLPLVEAAARGEEDRNGTRPRFAHLDQTWGRRDQGPRPLVSVEEGGYRMFRRLSPPRRIELYDVRDDPYEQDNVAASHPDVVKSLSEDLRAYLQAPEPEWGGPSQVSLSEMELGQLRALGYMVGGRDRQQGGAAASADQEAGKLESE